LNSTLDMSVETGEPRIIVEINLLASYARGGEVDDDESRVALAGACYSRKRGQGEKKMFQQLQLRAPRRHD